MLWLGIGSVVRFRAFLGAGRAPGTSPPPKYLFGWDCKCRKRSNAGAPGAKPPAKLTYSLPLPRRRRGSGGWGQKIKLKAGIAGDQKGKPPLAHRQPPHPPRRPGTSPPPQYLFGWYCKRRKRSNAGVPGAKPPAKLTDSLPLPRRGRGAGGWGQKIKLKAGIAGDKEGKPPCGFRNGKVSRRQRRQAPPPPLPPQKTTPLADLHRNPTTHCASCTTAREKSKKIRKLFGKPVDKPRKECYNGNATGA